MEVNFNSKFLPGKIVIIKYVTPLVNGSVNFIVIFKIKGIF